MGKIIQFFVAGMSKNKDQSEAVKLKVSDMVSQALTTGKEKQLCIQMNEINHLELQSAQVLFWDFVVRLTLLWCF